MSDPGVVPTPEPVTPVTGVPVPPSATPQAATASKEPASRALLVGYGIIGGIFLLYLIGWIIGTVRHDQPDTGDGALAAIAGAISVGLAIVSPVLWFGGVFLLTRHSRTVVKLAWQALGVVLLVPWIFVVGV